MAPSAYGNEMPILWSIDVAGGLQSRLNAADRLAMNPFWTQEGAIVYDASDRKFYGVDTGLLANKPLFTLDGLWLGGSSNIYSIDGVLTSPRTIQFGTNTLSFLANGPVYSNGVFTIFGFKRTEIGAATNLLYSSEELSLGAGQRLKLSGPAEFGGTATNGHVWTRIGTGGEGDWRSLPAQTTDTSIYKNDGTITGERTVGLGSNRLIFNSPGTLYSNGVVQFFGLKSLLSSAATNLIYSSEELNLGGGRVKLSGPAEFAGTSTNGHVWTRIGTGGESDWRPLPAQTETVDTSIYKNDGAITTDRTFSLGSNRLIFNSPGTLYSNGVVQFFGLKAFQSSAASNVIYSSEELSLGGGRVKLAGPTEFGATAQNGHVWTRIGPGGESDWRPAAGGTGSATNTLYSADGTLAGDRTVSGASKRLTFTNNSTFEARGALVTTLESASQFNLLTPRIKLGLVTNGMVLQMKDIGIGTADFYPVTNLYNANGILASDRAVDLGQWTLTWQGFKINNTVTNFSTLAYLTHSVTARTNNVFADTVTIKGTNAVFLNSDNNLSLYSSAGASLYGVGSASVGSGGSLTLNAVSTVLAPGNVMFYQSSNVLAKTAHIGAYARLVSTNGQLEMVNPSGNVIAVSNVLQMIASPVGPNTAGQYVQTLGYYNVGDLGGGLYYSRPYLAGQTNYGNFQSTYNTNFMWSLLMPWEGISLRQYGAKGDGITDDTPPFVDWMKDINQRIGILSVGVYMIRPYSTAPNAIINIKGTVKLGHSTVIESSPGIYFQNCAVFKRFAGSSTEHLFNVTNSASLNLFDVVLDGNKPNDNNNTATLYYNNNGGPVYIEGCRFQNSYGHGLRISGTNAAGSQVRNCRVYDVRRGMRFDFTYGLTVEDCSITRCWDNCLWIYQCHGMSVRDTYISDGGVNGIAIEGSIDCRFINLMVEGHKRQCVNMSLNGYGLNNIIFANSVFRNANCSTNQDTNIVASAAGTQSTVGVEGTTAGMNASRITFANCILGGDNTQPGYPRFGTNAVKTHFEWLASIDGSRYAWNFWTFSGNIHKPPITVASDYYQGSGPLIGLTNNVVEMGVYRSTGYPSFHFGPMGGITSQGWRMDLAEGGGSTTADLLSVPTTSHKILKAGTAIGTPALLELTLPDLKPPFPKPGPLPE
jgi:hypothetical protein